MTSNSDNDLIFSKLIEQHAGVLWKVAFTWCRQPADRDDLIQEITLQLWRAFPKYDSTRPFSTWMYRIALNVAITHGRCRKRRETVVANSDAETAPTLDLRADPTQDERLAELFQIIDLLADHDRALLMLWLDGCTYAAIADILGITETNVAVRLNRLKLRIKNQVHE